MPPLGAHFIYGIGNISLPASNSIGLDYLICWEGLGVRPEGRAFLFMEGG